MEMLKIGETIKAKRRDRKLTQEEFATALGVTKAAVSKWENEESYPDITTLPQIATFFHITMDELFGYKLEHKPLKIVNQYHFGLSLDDVDMCILDYGTVEECGVHKREVLVGDKYESTWEIRVHFVSTEDNFPHTLQKHIKQGVLVDGYSVRIADEKVIDDDKPNKHYVCKEKVWEYKNTDRKYLYQMLKEQISMGLIAENDTW